MPTKVDLTSAGRPLAVVTEMCVDLFLRQVRLQSATGYANLEGDEFLAEKDSRYDPAGRDDAPDCPAGIG
jgi:hypothetical protein